MLSVHTNLRSALLVLLPLVLVSCHAQDIHTRTHTRIRPVPQYSAGARAAEGIPTYEFAVLSDLHVGEGFPVFNSSDENYSTHHLKSAVASINAYAALSTSNLQYVIITGDMTSSAQISEFNVTRAILDTLSVPWYPLMGNHDVWTYDANGQTAQPHGDQVFAQYFNQRFVSPSTHSNYPITLEYDNSTVFNPKYNVTSHFINYRMEVGSLVFLALDWNTRHQAILGKPGALPNAELYNFTGGTFQWLEAQLQQLAQRHDTVSQVVLLQHQPFRSFPIPSWYFTFNDEEKKAIRDLLSTYLPVSKYWGVMAGHLHRWYDGTSFDEWPTFRQWETDACKGQWDDKNISSAWSLVQVVDNGSTIGNLSRHYGSDCTACPPTLVYPAQQDR